MECWVGVELWAAQRASLWTGSLVTDTAIWFLTAGIVLFFGVSDASRHRHHFRRKARETLSSTALIQGYVSLATLPFWSEFALQPLFFVAGGLAAISATRREDRVGKQFAVVALVVLGVAYLINATVAIASRWNVTDKFDLVRQLLLPVWLTVGLLPFVYALALYAAYGRAFLDLRLMQAFVEDPYPHSRVALLLGFNVHLDGLGYFASPWPQRLLTATSFEAARDVVRDFRALKQSQHVPT
jgi:hypothetical protein